MLYYINLSLGEDGGIYSYILDLVNVVAFVFKEHLFYNVMNNYMHPKTQERQAIVDFQKHLLLYKITPGWHCMCF